MTTYSIQSLAYLKILLHASKFPSSTVTGLLLGYHEVESNLVVVSDVIPLLHHWTDLSPMMEVALQLVEIHCKSKNMKLVGLYVENSRLEDVDIPFTSTKVADAVKREFSDAIVLVVDNQKLASDLPALVPYISGQSSSWTKSTMPSSKFSLTDPTIVPRAREQARAGKHKQLGDFDEYLEDVTIDWLNNKGIAV